MVTMVKISWADIYGRAGSGDSNCDWLSGEVDKDMLGYEEVKLAEQKNDWDRENLVRRMVKNRNYFAADYSVERHFPKTIVILSRNRVVFMRRAV